MTDTAIPAVPDTAIRRIGLAVTYSCSAADVIDLPEGRTWEDVASLGVKYDTCFITWTDGTTCDLPFHAEIDTGAIDTKRPDFEVRAVDAEGAWADERLMG